MRDDKHGSCWYSWSKQGRFYLNDKSLDGCFDCFTIVQSYYDCSFVKAMQHIVKDFNLNIKFQGGSSGGYFNSNKKRRIVQDKRKRIKYQVYTRKFNKQDLDYWNQFDIDESTLKHFEVSAVNRYKNNKNNGNFRLIYTHSEENPCYLYKINDNIKLYKPLADVKNKWRSNVDNSDIFGLKQLPAYGKELIISSGLKDLMCLHEMGYHSIAPQSESILLPKILIDRLKRFYTRIVVLFDIDDTGMKQMDRYAEFYNIEKLVLPKYNDLKDVADYVKELGLHHTKNIISDEFRKRELYEKGSGADLSEIESPVTTRDGEQLQSSRYGCSESDQDNGILPS